MTGNHSIHVIQITDTHLLADPDQRLGQWCTNASFNAVVADIHDWGLQPDALLLTGDLVHDESAAGYQRLATRLQPFNAPILAIPGNHDDPECLSRHLHAGPPGEPFRLGRWDIHLLDSHIPGRDFGRLDPAQLQRLRAQAGVRPALVAVHHPPAAVGCAWIDALGLEAGNTLLDVLTGYSNMQAVVCGHVHQASDQRQRGIRQITTPSTCRQFLPGGNRGEQDPHRSPGYRSLYLHPDGQLSTQVHRVPRARQAGLA